MLTSVLISALRMALACSALLLASAHAQMPGAGMSPPMSGGYPMSPPMSGAYPMSPGMSPPMSSPMGGFDPGYGTSSAYGQNPAYGVAMGQGEGQRKRAAFLGPLLMQLMPMIVNPMVQSFVDSRRPAGSPPDARSLTEAYAMAPTMTPGQPMAPSGVMQAQAYSGPMVRSAAGPEPSPASGAPPSSPMPSVSPPAPAPSSPMPSAAFEAGIAYEVFLIQPDGTESRISSSERTHQQGDRFYVRFMTNLPGQVVAFNVDPAGRRSSVGEWSVDGGFPQRLPARGHFRFEGNETGRELLEFQFTPCRSASPGRQRAIRVVEEAQTALKTCTEALASPPSARRMRAIVAVEDDKTAFATAPAAALSDEMPGLSVTLEFRRE
jgi:hypothetical protein